MKLAAVRGRVQSGKIHRRTGPGFDGPRASVQEFLDVRPGVQHLPWTNRAVLSNTKGLVKFAGQGFQLSWRPGKSSGE